MEFSLGFTTVRRAHFHMQANRIDFSLFVFAIVTILVARSLSRIRSLTHTHSPKTYMVFFILFFAAQRK